MLLFRRVLFYLFFAFYLITCPLLILFAMGYIVEGGHDPHLLKTGALSVATVPQGAHIYLGPSRFAEKTPTVVMDLKPADYQLRIRMQGRQKWENLVSIQAGEATVLDHILLVAEKPVVDILFDDPFKSLVPLDDTPFLILSKEDNLHDS